MGNFSRHTFDKLKHYVGVRLQQGVPILDADWNEQEDVRRFELQAFLKWFVGNGVPRGDDGFHVMEADAGNDFAIEQGRCLVEGWDVANDRGESYASQRLFGNDALARAWGVAPLPALTTPAAARTDRVYLDVWEREVGAAEDPALVNPAIGIETSVRLKREWVVRVAEGAAALPAAPAGHVFYEIAALDRPAGAAKIARGQIRDLRRTGLTIVSHHDIRQITADAYGADYSLDLDGAPNLRVSLREAVNALLRNQLPGSPVERVAADISLDTIHHALVDARGVVWVFYRAVVNGTFQIFYNRYDPDRGEWSGKVQLTAYTKVHFTQMDVVEGSDGIWLFYTLANATNKYELWTRRYDPRTDAWGTETLLTANLAAHYPSAVVDGAGDIWVCWSSDGKLWYRRYERSSSSWGANTQLTAGATTTLDESVRVVADRGGDVWVFWPRKEGTGASDIYCKRFNRLSNAWGSEERLSFDTRADYGPVPLVDASDGVWVFWTSDRSGSSDGDILYRRFSRTSGAWGPETQLAAAAGNTRATSAVVGSDGDVWVFWSLGQGAGQSSVWASRYTGDAGWGRAMQVANQPPDSYGPRGLLAPDGDIWVVWYSYSHYGSVWARKLVPSI